MSLTRVSYAMINGTPLNVLDFGAIGDGSTDCTAAFQAAFNAVPTDGVSIYVPAGVYKLTDTITVANKAFMLYGDGMNVSVLKWTGAGMTGENGISYTSTQQYTITIQDISLQAVPNPSSATTLAGTALNMVYPEEQTNYVPTLQLTRVSIRPTTTGDTFNATLVGGWTTCIYASDAGQANYTECQFTSNFVVGTKGLSFAATHNANVINILNCIFNRFDTAIYIDGPQSTGGYVVTACTFDACNNGIVDDVPADYIAVTNCYFQFFSFGFKSLARTTTVIGSRFDAGADGSPTGYAPGFVYGIYIGDGVSGPYDANIISGNSFAKQSALADGILVYGVVLDSGVVYSNIVDNAFGTISNYGKELSFGVVMLPTSRWNTITNNVGVAVDCLCSDTGSDNVVYRNLYTPLGAMPITGATPALKSGNSNFTLDSAVYLTQTGATTVTNFTNAYANQIIIVIAGDGNSTIQNNAGMLLANSANYVMGANDTLSLYYDGLIWREIGRSKR
jgi:hypothetical protein